MEENRDIRGSSMEGSRWATYVLLIHLSVPLSFILGKRRISESEGNVQIACEFSFYRLPVKHAAFFPGIRTT